jgi:hypothetical protein
MKIVFLGIDYYDYPLIREKRVKYIRYKCGIEPLSNAIDLIGSCNSVDRHLFITGGLPSYEHRRLFQSAHACRSNHLQDFSGYLEAAEFFRLHYGSTDAIPVFFNSSCPPSYLHRTVSSLINRHNHAVAPERIIIAPAVSYLFKRKYLWAFRPHLQSYCFAMTNSVVRDLIRFISTVNQSGLAEKKDFIENLELGMSKFFMEESPDIIHYCGKFDKLIRLTNLLGVLRSNPCCLLDPRLSGISTI